MLRTGGKLAYMAAAMLMLTVWVSTAAAAQNRRTPQGQSQPKANSVPARPPAPRPQSAPQPRVFQPSQPGHHAGEWLRRYKDVPPDQQRKALESDPQFRHLAPERQERLRERLQRFNSFPAEKQQRILNRMETWEHLTPPQKQQARQLYSRIRELPPGRRHAMQNAINALRTMPPEARQRALDSGRFSQYSPEERQMLDGISQLPLAPAEVQPAPEE